MVFGWVDKKGLSWSRLAWLSDSPTVMADSGDEWTSTGRCGMRCLFRLSVVDSC
jgi:hypothetical protein